MANSTDDGSKVAQVELVDTLVAYRLARARQVADLIALGGRLDALDRLGNNVSTVLIARPVGGGVAAFALIDGIEATRRFVSRFVAAGKIGPMRR